MTPEKKVNRILLDAARYVYTDQPRTPQTIPIRRECPACGIERPICGSRTCIRREP